MAVAFSQFPRKLGTCFYFVSVLRYSAERGHTGLWIPLCSALHNPALQMETHSPGFQAPRALSMFVSCHTGSSSLRGPLPVLGPALPTFHRESQAQSARHLPLKPRPYWEGVRPAQYNVDLLEGLKSGVMGMEGSYRDSSLLEAPICMGRRGWGRALDHISVFPFLERCTCLKLLFSWEVWEIQVVVVGSGCEPTPRSRLFSEVYSHFSLFTK